MDSLAWQVNAMPCMVVFLVIVGFFHRTCYYVLEFFFLLALLNLHILYICNLCKF
jgi:hypothetical protein